MMKIVYDYIFIIKSMYNKSIFKVAKLQGYIL